MLLSSLTELLGGTLKGQDLEIIGASTLEEAAPTDIAFLANRKYRDQAMTTRAGAVIVQEPLERDVPQIITGNPYLYFARVLHLLYPEKPVEPGISPMAWVHPDALVHEEARIYPHVYVGAGARVSEKAVIHPGCFVGDGACVGEHTVLNPNVVVYDGCSIGRHCIIHAGVVIGSDGFGFAWDGQRHFKVPQKGVVIVGDHVEIGSNCTIDRAALTSTRIGSDVKMDNLVQIGHNVVVGDHTIIVAQTGISGSARIGSGVVLAGQCGVAGHITIGDGVTAAGRTGIATDIPPGKVISGFPSMDHTHWLRVQKVYHDLPDLLKRVRELERKVKDLGED
ncbi:MAG TPA: UDP-3-O-(3-hydroxymyristoyl)glucosamine N-acyltransferase [Deltaproteobacteria bacterium]|nr:UDP-3-O-(3-hydroxymyristoyl)glucosamine N-acyltransferase [Deltaproteobacteria bacterium]HPR55111.1 UDP-3-O-(3-hydroxymyristoyl)glucosamine N-acyltransferase [Deltaproteobacteria bacterium]HXK47307.1 UDP-3-O-(3-hydroxymyristoyl)glucosamine N-acyltransferase [Deltaproteobacteria bacterium]